MIQIWLQICTVALSYPLGGSVTNLCPHKHFSWVVSFCSSCVVGCSFLNYVIFHKFSWCSVLSPLSHHTESRFRLLPRRHEGVVSQACWCWWCFCQTNAAFMSPGTCVSVSKYLHICNAARWRFYYPKHWSSDDIRGSCCLFYPLNVVPSDGHQSHFHSEVYMTMEISNCGNFDVTWMQHSAAASKLTYTTVCKIIKGFWTSCGEGWS